MIDPPPLCSLGVAAHHLALDVAPVRFVAVVADISRAHCLVCHVAFGVSANERGHLGYSCMSNFARCGMVKCELTLTLVGFRFSVVSVGEFTVSDVNVIWMPMADCRNNLEEWSSAAQL